MSSPHTLGGCNRFLVLQLRHHPSYRRRWEEQKSREKERQTVTVLTGEASDNTEEYRTQSRRDATDVVAKPRTRGPQQGREQRRQIHREQREHALAQTDGDEADHKHRVMLR